MITVPPRRASGSPKKGEALIVSTKWWNDLVLGWFRGRVRSLVTVPGDAWRHPWHSRLIWDPAGEGWSVETQPGFCVRVPHRDSSPVAVLPAEDVWTPDGEPPADDVPLGSIDATGSLPRLRIDAGSWRALGTDAGRFGVADLEAVPRFFLDRGVIAGAISTYDSSTGTISSRQAGSATDLAEARLLRACDLVLQADRPAARLVTEILPGLSTGAGLVSLRVTLGEMPAARGPAWLRIRRAAAEPEIAAGGDSAVFLLAGGLAQPGYDTTRIATLYLLSPPGTAAGSAPDGSWEPHVRHDLFWNMQHVVAVTPAAILGDPITLTLPGLAGLAAQAIANRITSAINDQAAMVNALLRGARVEGRFFGMG